MGKIIEPKTKIQHKSPSNQTTSTKTAYDGTKGFVENDACENCGSLNYVKQGCHGYCYDCSYQWGCGD